jgi:hypothetical protein
MDLSSTIVKRWVIDNVDSDAPYLARRMAAKYEVKVAEVVAQALFNLDEWLEDGGEIPDGWRTV